MMGSNQSMMSVSLKQQETSDTAWYVVVETLLLFIYFKSRLSQNLLKEQREKRYENGKLVLFQLTGTFMSQRNFDSLFEQMQI